MSTFSRLQQAQHCNFAALRKKHTDSWKPPGLHPVLALQHRLGNSGVYRLVRAGIQPKLEVSQPGDRYEREADQVAEAVLRLPDTAPVTARAPRQRIDMRMLKLFGPATRPRGSISGSGRGFEANRISARVIGPSDDPAEREADTIADAIIARKAHGKPSQITAAPIQAKGPYGGPCSSEGREAKEEEPEATPVQAKLERSGNSNGALSARLDVRHGAGEPLPPAIRRNFESQLGVPLGGVQVHRDGEAGELARSIDALAFTAGQDVYFAPGRYAPDTPDGAHLIAHELVHVAQQGSDGRNTPIRRFTLKGFNPGQEAQMRAAVTSAKRKIADCTGKGIPVHDLADILRGLDQADYVFVQDLDACGSSRKITDTIKIGPAAFDRDACCDLDSTLAHECAHSFAWGFEKFARKVECKCFGCSCG